MMRVPLITLNNGQKIPQLGLGTWLAKEGQVNQAVKDAIDIGYRHIDTAFAYENEAEVGSAIKAKIEDGTVTRDELWVTSKLWNTFHSRAKVFEAIDIQLQNLQLDYLDMYLMHWPMSYVEGGEIFPKDANGKFRFHNIHFTETWKAMEDVLKAGKVRGIGLSNFNSEQVQEIIDTCSVKPAILQVESNPYLNQKKLMEFCAKRDIKMTAYSALGNPAVPWKTADDPVVMNDPKILAIAEKHGKTPAQVCIRYQLDRGNIVLAKSVHKPRIEENSKVFDFKLSAEDVESIDSLDRGYRGLHLRWVSDHPLWPFHIPF